MNVVARASIIAMAVLAGLLFLSADRLFRSSYVSGVDIPREQPVPFSHKHHVSGLGIDCRYCHTSVEQSAVAGIPPTHTCMTCHSQVWAEAPILEPVRESYRTERPIQWARVHDLPDFAYFDHSIHIKKGIGCTTCHGPIGEMPLTWQSYTLYMEWCLQCHRNPEKYVRPREEVFNPHWRPPADQLERGRALVEEYNIRTQGGRLTDCSICHR